MRLRLATLVAPALLLIVAATLSGCAYETRTASAYYYSDYDYYTSRAFYERGY